MRLLLTTYLPTRTDPAAVLAAFDEDLFRALAPPYPRLRVDCFEGAQPGNTVAVTMAWGVTQQRWVSVITEAGAADGSAWFVDEGRQLPWPFRQWRHRHVVRTVPAGGVAVVDDLTYHTAHQVLDWLVRPALWALLAYRKPLYRRLLG